MKTLISAAALLAALAAPAFADEKYDRKIDEAAARIVAGKIGGIRGGLAIGQEPVFVPAVSSETTGSIRRRFATVARVSSGHARVYDERQVRTIVF